MTNNSVEYEDRLVSITKDAITFRTYYFPFGTSKRVEFTQVTHIEVKPATVGTGRWRIWGTGSPWFWFPLDWDRPSKEKVFFHFRKNTSVKIGFTVEDAAKVEQIFQEKGLLTPST